MKSSEGTLHRPFGDKRGKLSQSSCHLCQASQKLLKPRGFKEVALHRATIQALTGPSDRRQMHIFAKAFYLSKEKLFFACVKLTFLVVHGHIIIFPYTVLLNWKYSHIFLF
jgi:hypothetical protein